MARRTTIRGCDIGRLLNSLNHQDGLTPKDRLSLFSGLTLVPNDATLVEAIEALDPLSRWYGQMCATIDNEGRPMAPGDTIIAGLLPATYYLPDGTSRSLAEDDIVPPSLRVEVDGALALHGLFLSSQTDRGGVVHRNGAGTKLYRYEPSTESFRRVVAAGGGAGTGINDGNYEWADPPEYFVPAAAAAAPPIPLLFSRPAPPPSTTNQRLLSFDGSNEDNPPSVVAGKIVGIAFRLSGTHTDGSATISATINGTPVSGIVLSVAATDTEGTVLDPADGDDFDAGDDLGIAITTDGSWDGVGMLSVILYVTLDPVA